MDRKVLIGISTVVVLLGEPGAGVAFIIAPSRDGHSSTHRHDLAGGTLTFPPALERRVNGGAQGRTVIAGGTAGRGA